MTRRKNTKNKKTYIRKKTTNVKDNMNIKFYNYEN